MTTRRDIDFVELADRPTTFFMQRLVQASLPEPWSDPPHRHNFQEMIFLEAGRWRHSVDGHRAELLAPAVSLIGKGQVHVVEGGADLSLWIVRFTDDFLPASLIGPAWNYHATLFNQLGPKQTMALRPAEMRELVLLLEQIEREYARPASFQQESALRHLLSVLIIRIERLHQSALGADHHGIEEYRVYQQFMTLLEQEFARHHDVEYYAGALSIAPAKLARLLGRIVGRPTKQLIDERIILEARRYLHYTDLSVKEIAFALGYGDLFHFSKTFKRLARVAPQAFREQRRKMT